MVVPKGKDWRAYVNFVEQATPQAPCTVHQAGWHARHRGGSLGQFEWTHVVASAGGDRLSGPVPVPTSPLFRSSVSGRAGRKKPA
jgi:hypothetical protein